MNIAKRLYCRVFQKVFWLAIPLLPYREPERLQHMEQLPEMFLKHGINKVLLVTDSQLRGAGLTAELEQLLPAGGVECAVYDKTAANPTVNNVEEARRLYLAEGCQGLLAYGGGSSMDCAKGVGARLARPNKTLAQMKGILKIRRKLPLLAAVPTTAGTGSEVTLAAVITDEESRFKYPINDFPLIPRVAVLDPKATYTLPKHMTATTGMDALTHAVEAYIGGSTTKKTRAYAIEAVKLIFANLEQAYVNGWNKEARRNMLQAAYLAGNAFSQSYVGYIHAVAHSLGGAYNIPHGLANAVLLPVVLEAYGSAVHKKLHILAVEAGVAAQEDSDSQAAGKFIAEIREMNRRMGIPTTLPGIQEQDIPSLAKRADKEANPLYPVPVLWDAKELETFYYQVMEKGADHD